MTKESIYSLLPSAITLLIAGIGLIITLRVTAANNERRLDELLSQVEQMDQSKVSEKEFNAYKEGSNRRLDRIEGKIDLLLEQAINKKK